MIREGAGRVLALGAAVALLATSCAGGAAPTARPPVPIGAVAPAFALADHTGRVYSLSSYAGQKVLLVFYMGYF